MNAAVIDVNVYLSRWPTRRIREDVTQRLVDKLIANGIVEAWAGSFEALLHKDIEGVNSRLVEECQSQSTVRLVPFGAVNPLLPDWEEDVRRCAEVHRMPGIRLHPNYHGYGIADPVCLKLLQLATEHKLIVTLAAQMEDERMMHPLLRVAPVDLAPLTEVIPLIPGLRLAVLNAGRQITGEKLTKLLTTGEVFIDIAMTEGLDCVQKLSSIAPVDRILFGSYAPFHYVESGLLKLQESVLALPQLEAIRFGNARRLLPGT